MCKVNKSLFQKIKNYVMILLGYNRRKDMKKIIRNIDKPLLILSIILFTGGLIMIFSASNITAFMKYEASPYRYFMKQTIFLVVSVICSLFLIRFHSKSYHLISTFLVYGIIASLGLLLVYGTVKNRAISWFNFGFFSLQPSEFAKIIIIVWIASYYEKYKDSLEQYVKVLYPIMISIIIAGLIFAQPDLGTTIIFSSIVASLFFLAPIGKEIKNKVIMLVMGAIVIVALVLVSGGGRLLTSGQLSRFDFKNPCSNEKFYSTGNQVCNGYIAINHGKLTGVGLGNSTQKYLYLPEAHTDFIFAITMEELGFIGAVVIMILYFLLIGRIIKIARDSYNTRGFLICMGVAVYIVIHIFVNLGGIFGMIPMTGVPLPFMSYGGSFLMCTVFALTLVQRVNIENNLYKEKKLKKTKKS